MCARCNGYLVHADILGKQNKLSKVVDGDVKERGDVSLHTFPKLLHHIFPSLSIGNLL